MAAFIELTTDSRAQRKDSRVSPRWVGGLLLASVMVRVSSALYQGDRVVPLPGAYDQISYQTVALRLLGGHGFTVPTYWWPATQAGQPTSHWSFLYILYLAGVYALFGVHPIVARVIQAVVAGILHPWLTWRIGSRLFGRDVGVIGSVVVTFYAYFVYYAGSLMTETFYILSVLAILDVLTSVILSMDVNAVSRRTVSMRRLGRYGWRPWIILGLALGVAVLLRQVVILVIPLLYLWMLWSASRAEPGPQGSRFLGTRLNSSTVALTRGLVVSLMIAAAMVVPWTVHNYVVFHRFVPLNTNAGFAFFWGNNPIQGTHFVAVLPDRVYAELIPPKLRSLNEAALDDALLKRGLNFVIDDPRRYFLLSISRIPDYFVFWPLPGSGLVSNLSRVGSFGILLPFMIWGIYLSWTKYGRWATTARRSAIILLYLFATSYTLVHVLTWTLIRYRLPVDAVLVLFAAVALREGWVIVRGQLGDDRFQLASYSRPVDESSM